MLIVDSDAAAAAAAGVVSAVLSWFFGPSIMLLVLVCYFLIRLLRLCIRQSMTRPFPELPVPPRSHWLTGHVLQWWSENIERGMLVLTTCVADGYGRSGLWIVGNPTLCLTHPRDVRAVFHASADKTYPKWFDRPTKQFLDKYNLFVLNGREWKYHHSAIVKVLAPNVFIEHAQDAIQRIMDTMFEQREYFDQDDDDDAFLDISVWMKMITADVFFMAILSTDMQSRNLWLRREESPIVLAVEKLGQDLVRRAKCPMNPANVLFPPFPSPLSTESTTRIEPFYEGSSGN